MNSDWTTLELGEVIDDIAAGPFGSNLKTSCFVPDGFPIIDGANLKGIRVTDNVTKFVSNEKAASLHRSIAHRGDVVVTISGTIGQIAYVPNTSKYEAYLCSQRQFRATFNSKRVDVAFLVYYFHTYEGVNKILAFANQVGVPALSQPLKNFRKISVALPPLPTQRRIAAVLSALDDKIELNNRINANLEAQAQALFRSWFVDFEPWGGELPVNWREVSLDEMTSKFGTGLNPRKNFQLGHGTNYYVTIKNMGNNRIYLDDKCDKVDDAALEKINKRAKLQKGDLLFSGIGTIGRVAMVVDEPTNWSTSESVFNLHPAEGISTEFLYELLLSPAFQDYVQAHAQGAVQQGIRMSSLKEYTMSIPSNDVLRQFDELLKPMIGQINVNNKENDALAALRDALLPKLMRGEINVEKVEVAG